MRPYWNKYEKNQQIINSTCNLNLVPCLECNSISFQWNNFFSCFLSLFRPWETNGRKSRFIFVKPGRDTCAHLTLPFSVDCEIEWRTLASTNLKVAGSTPSGMSGRKSETKIPQIFVQQKWFSFCPHFVLWRRKSFSSIPSSLGRRKNLGTKTKITGTKNITVHDSMNSQ